MTKPYAARELLRDAGMVDVKGALRDAEGKTSLDGKRSMADSLSALVASFK